MPNTFYVNVLFIVFLCFSASAQTKRVEDEKALKALISNYSSARENQDTVLLKSILTEDIDQLVSTGEWRTGLVAAMKGMSSSTQSNPGSRTLTVDKIKLLSRSTAIVDARYVIKNADGTERNMWSSFIAIKNKKIWKISSIRNMLPAK